MDLNKIFIDLKDKFPQLDIYQNHPLAPYTTLKIGGPADIFIHTKNDFQFKSILKHLSKKQMKTVTIIGSGSNVIISDSGIKGIVIKNSSQKISILSNNKAKISSGVQLSYAINHLVNKNLISLEEFAYIPGTIGGAIYGNIHGIDNNFSKYIQKITVFNLQTSEICHLKSDELDWDYDKSYFQTNPHLIILFATFQFQTGDSIKAKTFIQEIIQKKSTTQLMNSAGCTFKNPDLKNCLPIWNEKKSVGWIVDQELGWKGKQIGGAQISPLHGNFIINTGNATAKDYYTLAKLIQDEVFNKFHLKLEFEVKFIGEF